MLQSSFIKNQGVGIPATALPLSKSPPLSARNADILFFPRGYDVATRFLETEDFGQRLTISETFAPHIQLFAGGGTDARFSTASGNPLSRRRRRRRSISALPSVRPAARCPARTSAISDDVLSGDRKHVALLSGQEPADYLPLMGASNRFAEFE